jgi:hypothetical protein
MIASGLIVEQFVNTKGLGSKKRLVPSISKGYNWNDFFSEFGLTSMELSHAYVGNYKTYFVKVGHFHGRHFNIQDQLKGKVAGCGVSTCLYYGGCREQQLKLVQGLATVQLNDSSTNATTLSSSNSITAAESTDVFLSSSSMTDEQKNLQNIVKTHFF